MGLRRRGLAVLLPFPASVYAHDHWMAIAMAACGGLYMSDELLIDFFLKQTIFMLS